MTEGGSVKHVEHTELKVLRDKPCADWTEAEFFDWLIYCDTLQQRIDFLEQTPARIAYCCPMPEATSYLGGYARKIEEARRGRREAFAVIGITV